ncbi:Zn(II)2Cys6 transcription factor [Aspergillus stella-maris]|uniref:Zn(II)2Cys6 transcription factor n=1 Tax=Aspergillus stella-maris TaxID=1810926 RepID=UPI003CCD8F7E
MAKPRQIHRRTCDPCAASKVKCTKEHPVCSRCIQHGLADRCVYGRSRRQGKPPRGGRKGSRPVQAETEPGIGTTQMSERKRWHLADMFDTDFAGSALDGGWDAIARSGSGLIDPRSLLGGDIGELPSLHFDMPEEMQKWLDEQAPLEDQSMPQESLPPPGICAAMRDGSASSTMAETDTAMDESGTATDGNYHIEDEGDETDFQSGGSEQDHERAHSTCIAAACRTLSSLYNLSKGKRNEPLGPKAGPRSDIVLSTARTAVESVLRILNCDCISAHDPSLLSLLATIVFRVVNWYRVLYEHNIGGTIGDAPNSETPGRPGADHDSTPASQHHDNAGAYTISINTGLLRLPIETEIKMKAQLLLCEMAPVHDVCKSFAERSSASEGTWGDQAVCEEFVVCIQQKLDHLNRLLTKACL